MKKQHMPVGYIEEPEINEFRRLLNLLLTHSQNTGGKIYLITCAMQGEGKSTVSSFLAMSNALYQGQNTILADFDLRRPTVHKLYDLPIQSGVSEILSDSITLEKALKMSPNPNLEILTAGSTAQTPLEMFTVSNLQRIETSLREKECMVFLDSPPIIPVSDTLLLSNFVDGILLVVKAGQSQKKVVQRAIDMLQLNSNKLLGVVINNLENALPYYYSQSYYDYRYE